MDTGFKGFLHGLNIVMFDDSFEYTNFLGI